MTQVSNERLAEMLGAWEADERRARLGHGMNLHEIEIVSALRELLSLRQSHSTGAVVNAALVERFQSAYRAAGQKRNWHPTWPDAEASFEILSALYTHPAPDIIAAKDAEIERVTREQDAAQGWPERENITHYCADCEMVSVLHEGRCGCGSGRVVSISSMWTQAEAAEEALKAVWPFVAKHYSPHIESEFKLAEQVNNALRSFASLNGARP